MIKSQLFSITPHVSQVLGENWSNEFENINQAWQESYCLHSQDNSDLTSIIPFLPLRTKPTLSEIQAMIANRLELPISVFQKPKSPTQKRYTKLAKFYPEVYKNLTK